MTKQAKQSQSGSHRAPPIHEVGLSVATSEPGVINPYDVKGFHKALDGLPVAVRNPTIGILQVAALVGGASNVNMFDPTKGAPQKWWFVSDDETRVLQAQEDFLSYNWRRIGAKPGEDFSYPGFDVILKEFMKRLDEVRAWHEKEGSKLPNPSGCELYYDDVICLSAPGKYSFTMSEAMIEFDRAEKDRPASGWSSQWMESIDGVPDGDSSILKIQINQLFMVDSHTQEKMPILKITWIAGAARNSWEDVIAFYKCAHDHMLRRFKTLISQKVQATWN